MSMRMTFEQTFGKPLVLSDQGCFFVGGEYADTDAGRIRGGQMFVEYRIPAPCTRPFPVVMIHGGGQTGSNFLATPDGRKGWADWFLAQGYAVYVVDQAGRARSGFFPALHGATRKPTAASVAQRFTAPERQADYPQARAHTQWPGAGVEGDAVFDEFFSSQVESMADITAIERLNRAAGAALLDRIGPAILLTHSQSGPIGWSIADARPKLVKAIVAIEPNGPPCHEAEYERGAMRDGPLERPWGITRLPLAFEPAAADPAELGLRRQAQADAPGLMPCWELAGAPRRLVNLAGIPILIVSGEASYHAPYDHCTSKFLRAAGVAHDFVRLEERGIRGNGHMMMLEKNNLEIAALLGEWLEARSGG